MAKYVFAYHGGETPATPEEGAAEMAKWEAWLGGMGAAAIDMGNPVGKSWTVSGTTITKDGGSNPLSGYSIIEAASHEAACEIAKGCPIHAAGGSVEVAEIMEM